MSKTRLTFKANLLTKLSDDLMYFRDLLNLFFIKISGYLIARMLIGSKSERGLLFKIALAYSTYSIESGELKGL